MDAVQLVRWTRFAAKGGIGKCTAIHDCIAQSPEDLMFLKGDEIIVLVQISHSDDLFLGSCEDVIGRFHGKDVRFHSKLKRPVITKRSSVSTTKSSSPNTGRLTPPPSRTSSLTLKDQSPPSTLLSHPSLHSVAGHSSPPSTTDDEALNSPPIPISGPPSPSNSVVVSSNGVVSNASAASLTSNSLDSSQNLPSTPLRPTQLISTISPSMSPPAVSPLQIVKKSPTSPPLHQSSFAAAQEQLLDTHTSTHPVIPNDTFSTYDEHAADMDSDGEVGIGLSLLQNLAHDSDSDDSSFEHTTIHHHHESTVEGLTYDVPVDEEQTNSDDKAPILAPRVNIEQDRFAPGKDHIVLVSSRSSSPLSPTSPASPPSLSPPAHQQQFSISSRRPSLQSSSSWEGAGDIYDDYRYSRASMISGTSKARRSSVSSRMSASSKTSHRDAWDGHVYEPPPPIPDHKPTIDSVIAGENSMKTATELVRRSVESRKSDARKSGGSRKSTESESRRSRQELHFPQPPTIVNIQPNLLDHVTRESLRRSADASRTLTQADFRLSVESEASIYSRLSIIEQEPPLAVQGNPSSALPSTVPESSARLQVNSRTPSKPAPLKLAQQNSPLLHATWASPISSPSDSAFVPSSVTSPITSLFMPMSLTSLTTGMASALRQKVETDRKSDDQTEKNNSGGGDTTSRGIVVQDEEDIPSGVMQESSFDTEYSQDMDPNTSKDTIVLSEFARTDSGSDVDRSTPLSNLELPGALGGLGLPPSPLVPTQPPIVGVHSPDQPPESPASPQMLPLDASNRLRHPRPTLAELREGGGDPIPGTDKRRSLFLPHPNAPKAPSSSSGPMYLTFQQSSFAPQAPTPVPKQSVLDVMHMTLHVPPPPAMRQKVMLKGPTIYGQTDVDLGTSTGPVPITFFVDPPLPQAAARPPPSPSSNQVPPQLPPPQQDTLYSGTPSSPGTLPSTPRSPTNSPVPNHPVPEPGAFSGLAIPASLEANGRTGTGGVIPRANFFPKAPGVRPRSRSFSAFNSHSTQVEVPLPLSREESSRPLNAPTANDVRESLKASPRASLSPLPSQAQTPTKPNLRKASPLRPSPLSTTSTSASSHPRPGSIDTIPRAPGSPFAQQSFRRPSLSSTAPSSPTIAALNPQSLRPPHQLRQVTSSSTLNDATLSRLTSSVPSPSETLSASDPGYPQESPPHTQEQRTFSPHQQPLDPDQGATNGETDVQHISSPPTPNRQLSLRTKLSLPNLRRNRSKNDDSFALSSPIPEHDLSSTVQVQDLDFELVRPTIQFQHARSSEDSVILGRDTSVELPSRDAHVQRVASPSTSLTSPTGEGPTPWSRPSFSSTATPIITRATADTELNMDAHRHRESKWMSLMSSVPASQWRKNKKVKKLLHEGVPSSVRYLVWSHLTDGKVKVVPGVYFQLGNRERIAAASMIEEDIKTCFNDQPHLQGKRGPVLALLQAYLTMVPDVHYTRGLTLIAGQLLLHAPEEDAFWIFISVMDTHVRPYFSSNATQMDVDASLFSRVVEQNDSQLAKKLYVELGIEPDAICSFWFSTLFVSTLPPEYVNRTWDMLLYEGISFLFRIGFAVMTCCRRQILGANSPSVVCDFLRHPSPGWLPSTPEGFLSLAHSVKMKDEDIRKNRLKMEAQVKRQTQTQSPRHFPIATSISLLRS